MVPEDTDTEQVGPPLVVEQAGELVTSVVPVGAASVTLIGAVVVVDPVFLTVRVYTIGVVDPLTMDVGLTDLVTLTPVTDSVSVEPPVTGVPPFGGVPVTVAVSLTEPLDRSACVTVYVAEQVAVAPGSSEKLPLVTGLSLESTHVMAERLESSDGAAWASVTSTLSSVTLPVFWTAKVYVTV